jgi:signal transduction histidine kinase
VGSADQPQQHRGNWGKWGVVNVVNRGRSLHDRSRAHLREVAHDLLQPTTTIATLVEIALVQADIPESVQRCLEQIAKEAHYATDTCLLLLAEEHRETVRLDRLVDAAVESAYTTYSGSLSTTASPAEVMGDPIALRRAITNLFDNACRAAGETGQVEIRVGVGDADTVLVEVHDSGPGFGAGPRGRATVGLAVVRRVAVSHGGQIVVTSSPLGGACVRLELAAAGAPSMAPLIAEEQERDQL